MFELGVKISNDYKFMFCLFIFYCDVGYIIWYIIDIGIIFYVIIFIY